VNESGESEGVLRSNHRWDEVASPGLTRAKGFRRMPRRVKIGQAGGSGKYSVAWYYFPSGF
jgi:hypothetical protein